MKQKNVAFEFLKKLLTDDIRIRKTKNISQAKKFSVTYYKAEYERNIKRVNSPQGIYMKGKRQRTKDGRTRFWDIHSIYEFKKNKYHRG